MATSYGTTSHAVSKLPLTKWLTNKSLKLNLINRRRSKSRSSSSSSSLSTPNGSPILSTASSIQTPRSNDMNIIVTTTVSSRTNEEDELRQVFRRFDADDDGKISALELRSYFGSIGEYMSHEQAKAVIDDFDGDGDDSLDFQEFLRLMKRDEEEEAIHEERDRDDLKSAFEIFELEKGCITPRSVQRMLGKLGDTRTYDECKAMIQVFDKDGNGVLDFNEFRQMMA